MQFKAAFVTAAIASLAVASSVPRDDPSGNTCSTGAIQCCNTISNTSNPTIASLAGLLGIVLPSVNVAVGLVCSGISLAQIAGGACSAQAVCCQDTSNSFLSLGCAPIQL